MRFSSFAFALLLAAHSASGFVVTPATTGASWALRSSTATQDDVVAGASEPVAKIPDQVQRRQQFSDKPRLANGEVVPLTAPEINARYSKQMERLQEKDRTSKQLNKEDIQVIYEDDHIVVVDKPSGVLSVPGRIANPSLSQAVFEAIGCEMDRMDMMVVHRLGMDTSGLVVFAKTLEGMRGMNEIFRTRDIERNYEVLVCGHVAAESGMINLPLMRDYEFPPFMRVSTDDHQRALLHLESEDLTLKKILDLPKESVTKYQLIAHEEFEGQPVSRLTLTSLSGRTHQLNVHMAAFGHPIVGDSTYGFDGDAAANGGLTEGELECLVPNANRATAQVRKAIAQAANGKVSCVHAKSLKFRHPVSREEIALSSKAPF